ncbi:MAG: hypothetical protein AAGD96_21220 [Chloroflexota bacterium]
MEQNQMVERGAAGAGLLTILLGIIIVLIMPVSANVSEGFRTPIIAFEFAATADDLAFLSDADPDGPANRDKMDRGHRWDMLFPVAYGIFLALLLVQAAQAGFRPGWWFVPFALLAIPFDIWENTLLVSITGSLSNGGTGEEFLGALRTATWLKWGAIALGAAGLGWESWEKREYWSAGLAIMTGLVTAIAWMLGSEPFWVELMAMLVFIFYFWFVVKQCLRVARRKKEIA